MKSLLIAVVFMIGTTVSINAQNTLLTSYYGIKDALVNGDAGTASVRADEFLKASDSLQQHPLKNQLKANAKLLSASKDLAKQREYFSLLSKDFSTILREFRLPGQPVYEMYCPMKKAIWLSNEKEIRNPYFGKAMLNCGSITATLNQ